MKTLLITLLFYPVTVFASGPGQPPKQDEFAQIVLLAKPTKVASKLFLKGKEYSEEEAKLYIKKYEDRDSKNFPNGKEPYPRFQVEYTVTLKISKNKRGAIAGETLTVKWRDLAGSMCPHIPTAALSEEGIWYTGSSVNSGEHVHSVYWMANIAENLKVILASGQAEKITPAEQDGADQPASAPELKSEGKKKTKTESEGRSQ